MSNKWTKANTVAQFIIAFLILCTIIVTTCNILQQGKFNRNTLRPWVNVDPITTLFFAGDVLMLPFNVTCYGNSPACSTIHFSTYSFNNDTFPEHTFRAQLDSVSGPYSFVIPGESYLSKSKHSIFGTVSYTNKITGQVFIDRIILNKSDIEKKILQEQMYFHTYTQYYDFNNHKYGLRKTYLVVPKDNSCINVEFRIIRVSIQPL